MTQEKQKLVWIIGASTGIGAELAVQMANAGRKIIISARNEQKLLEVCANNPQNIISLPLDVTKKEDVQAVFDRIEYEFGEVECAIISAGTYIRDNPRNFDVKIFEDLFALNVMGNMNCLGAIIPRMVARECGQIAVISSVAGYVGLPFAAAYGGTKAALMNICESLYPYLKRHGIDLKLINPGFVKTPLTAKNKFPMPFLIDVDEAARIIIKKLKTKDFEIIFPWKMAFYIKLLHALPNFLRLKFTSLILKD